MDRGRRLAFDRNDRNRRDRERRRHIDLDAGHFIAASAAADVLHVQSHRDRHADRGNERRPGERPEARCERDAREQTDEQDGKDRSRGARACRADRHATRGVHRARSRRRPGQRRVIGRLDPVDERADEGRVELAPGRVLEPVQRLPDVERLAVRPRRRHRRERVADREDPGDQRDVLAGEPVEVAVAVPALVVVADPGPDELDVGQVADDRVAQRDVLLDDRVLGVGQLAGLAQDRVGDADLADVVEQPGESGSSRRAPRSGADPLGEEDAVAGDVLGVALRVAVLRVDGEDEALEDVERGRP